MKKVSIIGLLVVLSMVLAACGSSGDNATPTAVGGVGPVVTEAPGTLPTTAPVATETVAPVEMTPVGTMVGTAVGTNIPATGEKDINRLKNLLDLHVIDSQNNDLGEVNDMIVSTTDGQIRYVVLGSGGFLGIGEKDVLIPWNMVTLGMDSNNNNAFVFSGNADALKNAPDFNLGDVDFTNGTWDLQYNDYWTNPGAQTGTSVAGTPVGTSIVAQPTAGAGGAGPLYTAGGAADFVLASKLVISDVVDRAGFNGAAGTAVPGTDVQPTVVATTVFNDNSGMTTGTQPAVNGTTGANGNMGDVIGNVVDAVVDPQTGQVTYLVIGPNASLNLGDKWIPVPLSQVDVVYKGDGNNNILVLADVSRLSSAPSFDVDALPNTGTTGWDADLQSYWGVSR